MSPDEDRDGEGLGDDARPPAPALDPVRARRVALEALSAYREAEDAKALAAVFSELSDTVPAHWLLTGLLSVASQLVEYLAASEEVDPHDVLRALSSLEEADFEDEDEPEEPGDESPA